MTEPLFNLASIQQVTQEVAFEHFGFQAVHAVTAPELVMHAHAVANPDDTVAQSLSGLVLDAGYSFTHAVPIFDGRVVKPAVRRIRVGGKLLTNLMKEWVRIRSGTASAVRKPDNSSSERNATHLMKNLPWFGNKHSIWMLLLQPEHLLSASNDMFMFSHSARSVIPVITPPVRRAHLWVCGVSSARICWALL